MLMDRPARYPAARRTARPALPLLRRVAPTPPPRHLRSIGEKVGAVGKTSGVIPFIRVMDSLTLAISQGSLRRRSATVYPPVWHPEIEEFVEIRRPTGAHPNRKALNLHHGILATTALSAKPTWRNPQPHTPA